MTTYAGEKAATSVFHEAMMRAGGLRWAMPTFSAGTEIAAVATTVFGRNPDGDARTQTQTRRVTHRCAARMDETYVKVRGT